MLEIPAGKLDYIGEDPEEAALRELREETGASPKRLRFIGKDLGSPALLNEQIWMYLAEGLSFGDTDPDDDEFLELLKIDCPLMQFKCSPSLVCTINLLIFPEEKLSQANIILNLRPPNANKL